MPESGVTWGDSLGCCAGIRRGGAALRKAAPIWVSALGLSRAKPLQAAPYKEPGTADEGPSALPRFAA
jgi:hypothetical protein